MGDYDYIEVSFPEGQMGLSINQEQTSEGKADLVVEMVVPGSAADEGGVRTGDVLITVNGDYRMVAENNTPELFVAAVSPLKRPIMLTFKRASVGGSAGGDKGPSLLV